MKKLIELFLSNDKLTAIALAIKSLNKMAGVNTIPFLIAVVLCFEDEHLKDLPTRGLKLGKLLVHILLPIESIHDGIDLKPKLNLRLENSSASVVLDLVPLANFLRREDIVHVVVVRLPFSASSNLRVHFVHKTVTRNCENVDIIAVFVKPVVS